MSHIKRRKDLKSMSKRNIRRIIQTEAQRSSVLQLYGEDTHTHKTGHNTVLNTDKDDSNSLFFIMETDEVSNQDDSVNNDASNMTDESDSDLVRYNNKNDSSAEEMYNYNNLEIEYETKEEENKGQNVRKCFQEKLAEWAVDANLPHNKLYDLMSLLRTVNSLCEVQNLPKHPRTLLETPRQIIKRVVSPGEYCHFGLENGLRKYLLSNVKQNHPTIRIGINIDGLPISNSSSKCVWPILGSPVGTNYVFIIGLYTGEKKPNCSNDFLEDFINETKIIYESGFKFDGKIYRVEITMLVCDSPAKSFILNIKGHSGYSSCPKCHIYGANLRQRICFPDTKPYHKRTDLEMREYCNNEDNNSKLSAFSEISGFDLINDVVLDYMHIVCLGIMKKLVKSWLSGDLRNRVGHQTSLSVSKRLENLKMHVPIEFARKPRSLEFLAGWKATEFRQILLYSGPMVFQGLLKRSVYVNFLTLHVAMRILCNEKLLSLYGTYSHELLKHFVNAFIKIYGPEFVSHNVHCLLHLVEECQKFGTVDNFSAFKYENFLMTIKRMLRKSDKVIGQLYRRYTEIEKFSRKQIRIVKNLGLFEPVINSKLKTYPIICDCSGPYYLSATCSNITLNCSLEKDRCCGLLDNSIIKMEIIAFSENEGEYFVIGKKYNTITDFYMKPCPSSTVGIYVVSDLAKEMERWPLSLVQNKYVKFPLDCSEKFLVLSLLNSDVEQF
ncbi:PREDICTED: uncharacterized protein LOC105557157 isoform X1 [Vollenhovia emeryi]|uniref:uncharacterized protein LOC105557157 isoform X1 n=1 Tax=Vollenhovia emeryi TaxID=411798 RepID=UPI0005F472C8|nr:PREDICTED: uncharacterized protein LOC105557157 isoform X1 [Vollenhovia emeryi]